MGHADPVTKMTKKRFNEMKGRVSARLKNLAKEYPGWKPFEHDQNFSKSRLHNSYGDLGELEDAFEPNPVMDSPEEFKDSDSFHH